MSALTICDLSDKQVEEYLSLAMAELWYAAAEVAAMTPVTEADRIRRARALSFCAAAREWGGRVTYPLSRQLAQPRRKQQTLFERSEQLRLVT